MVKKFIISRDAWPYAIDGYIKLRPIRLRYFQGNASTRLAWRIEM